ncbi:hemolysin XhlA family protein [Alicyclobacillus shizuokensis]|uniref:hemolysin XhlA family protein n=1 Tax=Alicyclobacillus shizuokensis TaxID=392014 RepID=UPI00083657B1|nr:hemolysin XhlA family protein [Alicyclobacillus shizuokensis]
MEQIPGWAQDIRERVVRIETILTQYDMAKVETTHAKVEANEKRIERLEANQTWLWRTVIGALITGGVGALFILARGGV